MATEKTRISEIDRLLTELETRHILGCSRSFLARPRSRGVIGNETAPPPHIKAGHFIRYRLSDVIQWIEDHRVEVR